MSKAWPSVNLGELLKLERRPVKVVPEEQYAEIGIYCFGRGIFHKLPRSGFEVGNKDLFLIKEGDLILQVTFAWEGAVALSSTAEDGMYGSTRYPTFRVDKSKCFPPYLVNYFKTKKGREQLVKISPGSAGRNRVLSLKRLPEVFIPLPPLSEQQRIVAKIEELAAKIEEARGLRQKTVEEGEALTKSAYNNIFNNLSCDFLPLNKLICEGGKQVNTSNPNFYKYIYLSLEDIEFNTGKIKKIKTVLDANVTGSAVMFDKDVVLFSKLRPYLNKVVVSPFEGCATTELVVFVPWKEKITPDYLCAYLRTPKVVSEIDVSSSGTKMPRANMKFVRNLLVPIPPLSEQRRIVEYLDNLQAKTNDLKNLQTETQKNLDALTPSILDKAFKGEL